jgi:hypothetical protein
VPPQLAADALKQARQSEGPDGGPVAATAWPEVPTRVLICHDDRLFPIGFLRRVARKRLGIVWAAQRGARAVDLVGDAAQ